MAASNSPSIRELALAALARQHGDSGTERGTNAGQGGSHPLSCHHPAGDLLLNQIRQLAVLSRCPVLSGVRQWDTGRIMGHHAGQSRDSPPLSAMPRR
jgi:hypothetical protein